MTGNPSHSSVLQRFLDMYPELTGRHVDNLIDVIRATNVTNGQLAVHVPKLTTAVHELTAAVKEQTAAICLLAQLLNPFPAAAAATPDKG